MQWIKIDELTAYLNVPGGMLFRLTRDYGGAALCFVPHVQNNYVSYTLPSLPYSPSISTCGVDVAR